MKTLQKLSLSLAAASAALVGTMTTDVAPAFAQSEVACENGLGCTLLLDEEGYVERILKLEILGKKYNVDFLFSDYFGLDDFISSSSSPRLFWWRKAEATEAAKGIMESLGDVWSLSAQGDSFKITVELEALPGANLSFGDGRSEKNVDRLEVYNNQFLQSLSQFNWASFEEVFEELEKEENKVGVGKKTTPEPNAFLAILAASAMGLVARWKKNS